MFSLLLGCIASVDYYVNIDYTAVSSNFYTLTFEKRSSSNSKSIAAMTQNFKSNTYFTVDVFVTSSKCPTKTLVKNIPSKTNPETIFIKDSDIPQECITLYYIQFSLVSLDDFTVAIKDGTNYVIISSDTQYPCDSRDPLDVYIKGKECLEYTKITSQSFIPSESTNYITLSSADIPTACLPPTYYLSIDYTNVDSSLYSLTFEKSDGLSGSRVISEYNKEYSQNTPFHVSVYVTSLKCTEKTLVGKYDGSTQQYNTIYLYNSNIPEICIDNGDGDDEDDEVTYYPTQIILDCSGTQNNLCQMNLFEVKSVIMSRFNAENQFDKNWYIREQLGAVLEKAEGIIQSTKSLKEQMEVIGSGVTNLLIVLFDSNDLEINNLNNVEKIHILNYGNIDDMIYFNSISITVNPEALSFYYMKFDRYDISYKINNLKMFSWSSFWKAEINAKNFMEDLSSLNLNRQISMNSNIDCYSIVLDAVTDVINLTLGINDVPFSVMESKGTLYPLNFPNKLMNIICASNKVNLFSQYTTNSVLLTPYSIEYSLNISFRVHSTNEIEFKGNEWADVDLLGDQKIYCEKN